MAKKKLTATQKLRKNVLAAVKRRQSKYNISEDFIESLKSASYQTLKSLSSHRYKKLDNRLESLQSISNEDIIKPQQNDEDIVEKLLPKVLSQRNVTSPSESAKSYYRNLIKDTLSFNNITEITDAMHKADPGSYEQGRYHAMYRIALENIEVFNGLGTSNEPPNESNTADTNWLVYNAILAMIEEALDTGDKWQKYLADYLKGALESEISRYEGEEWKVFKAMEYCNGDLIDECRRYVYGSENLEEKKAMLEYILMLIRGHIPSDDERIALSEYIDMYDTYGDF